MIDKLLFLQTENTYPYRNLAVEEYLTRHVGEGEIILFLWQNRRTVVIGKNQNSWKECRVGELEEDGGYLVRRLSGGGAVYHDLGNLNFTFCVRHADYDVARQLSVILRAVESLGIEAKKTGRNDITVDGRKFSGNAFLQVGEQCYHHGTIMLDVDHADVARYLNVDPAKLISKGVDSVRSRIANLKEFRPDITVEMMAEALKRAFVEVYVKADLRTPQEEPEEIKEADLPQDEIAAATERFASWEWKYGRRIQFSVSVAERFAWGGVEMQLDVDEGRVRDVILYSDAMDPDVIEAFRDALVGIPYDRAKLIEAIDRARLLRSESVGFLQADEWEKWAEGVRADMRALVVKMMH